MNSRLLTITNHNHTYLVQWKQRNKRDEISYDERWPVMKDVFSEFRTTKTNFPEQKVLIKPVFP